MFLLYPHSRKRFCLSPQLIVIFFKLLENIILLCFAFHIAIEKSAVSLIVILLQVEGLLVRGVMELWLQVWPLEPGRLD